jgi:hypothetical protein
MIAVRQLTETETAAVNQRRAFRAKIEARAAALAAPAPVVARSNVVPFAVEAVAAETDPPLPEKPARKWWFELLGLAANTVSIRQIQISVASEFGMQVGELASPRRLGRLVVARQIAMMLCKDMIPTASYPQIGRKFGNRDHTTVLHACRVAPVKIDADPELRARVDKIRRDLATTPHDVVEA